MKRARSIRSLSTALLATGMLLPGIAPAQDIDEEIAEEPRRYNVEVIIFRYEQDVSVGSEVFLPDPPPEPLPDELVGFPESGDTGPLAIDQPADEQSPADVAEEQAVDAATEGIEPEFLVAPADALAMTDTISMLERLDVYQPLLHAAWTQAALPRESSITIELDMLTEPPENLTGRFTLYLSRFLHLDVDLALQEESGDPVIIDVPDQFGFTQAVSGLLPVQYRIQEDRIFKNGDTRYFDHPRFGLLARITRVEEPEETEETEETEEQGAESDVEPIANLSDAF